MIAQGHTHMNKQIFREIHTLYKHGLIEFQEQHRDAIVSRIENSICMESPSSNIKPVLFAHRTHTFGKILIKPRTGTLTFQFTTLSSACSFI